MEATRRRSNLPRRTREAYGPAMRIRVLGPLEISGENGPVVLGGPKQRAVLANLIVRANQLVPADALIDLVWGDEPEPHRAPRPPSNASRTPTFSPDRSAARAPPGHRNEPNTRLMGDAERCLEER